MRTLKSILLWGVIAAVGAGAFGVIALSQGETINAVWLLVAAVCVYAVAYRFYSRFIARKVFGLDNNRQTPAHTLNDGKDYVPTNKWVLFGHHFAAIAGAGLLVEWILAAQMGYLPGTIWIIVGVVVAGAVQDFVILFASMRRNGKSLGEMIKDEIELCYRTYCNDWYFRHYDYFISSISISSSKGACRKPLGNVYDSSNDSYCYFNGSIYALHCMDGLVKGQ